MSAKRIDFTQLDGLAVYQDTFDFLQTAYSVHGFEALSKAFGSKLIMHGVVDNGATVTDGYVIIDGELLPFVGGPKLPQLQIEELTDVELFGDSTTKTVYFTRRVRMVNVGDFPLTDLKRWKTDLITVDDSDVIASAKAVKKLNDNILSMLGFETTVILKGCDVNNVNTGANTLEIAAGVVMISNSIISTPAYIGNYPVYLKPDGTYVTVDPGGINVKYDPYTSQRYADVLKRATTSTGEIKLFKTLSDRFDVASGIGKWEMTGFKICDDMRSRVPLGYDRRLSDPFDGIWDANYNTPGNVGGLKQATLDTTQLPNFTISIPGKSGGDNNDNTNQQELAGGDKNLGETAFNFNLNVPYSRGKSAGQYGQAHENRQPYRVIVYAERI